MALKEALLHEFDHEMNNTRVTLERVPADKFGWKPHEKSLSMRDLATHIATIPDWVIYTIENESYDMSPGSHAKPVESKEELIKRFDANVAKARKSVESASDERLMKNWTLSVSGKALFTMSRMAVLRGFVMNHLIHHRGQLTVYLRLNDIPVPAVYGPSADEGKM